MRSLKEREDMEENRLITNPLSGRSMSLKYDDELLKTLDENDKKIDECRAKGHSIYHSMFGLHQCITCKIEKDERRGCG